MAKAEFRAPTAFCPHCQESIEKAVGNLSGVTKVEVDLAGQNVGVEYDPAVLDTEAVRQRIEGAGFPAVVIQGDG